MLWPLDGGGSTVKIQGNELQNDVQDPQHYLKTLPRNSGLLTIWGLQSNHWSELSFPDGKKGAGETAQLEEGYMET